MPHSTSNPSCAGTPASASANSNELEGRHLVGTDVASGGVQVIQRGRSTWLTAEAQSEALLGPSAPDWFALKNGCAAVLVKEGHRRATWKVILPDGRSVFAKVFDDVDRSLSARWRRLTHHTGAECEWQALVALQTLRVPCVRPLALGVQREPARKLVLVTEGIEGAESLAEGWESGPSGPTAIQRAHVRELTEAVARLWAVGHDRGFAHPDGHPANVLIRESAAGGPAALFVDVAGGAIRHPGSTRKGPVAEDRALRSLAQLDQYFHRVASRSQRLRFWRCYWSFRAKSLPPQKPKGERKLLLALSEESAVHAAALARQRDRRLRRNGKYFARLVLDGGWQATVTLRLERRHVFAEPDVADRSASEWRALLPSVAGCTAARGGAAGDSSITVIRFVPKSALAAVIETLRGSSARRFFERWHQLRHRDVAAPLALAYLERRGRLGLLKESLLVVPAGD